MSTLYEKTLKMEEERFSVLYDVAVEKIEKQAQTVLLVNPGQKSVVYWVETETAIYPFEKTFFVKKLIAALNDDPYFVNYTFSVQGSSSVLATVNLAEPMIKPAGHLS